MDYSIFHIIVMVLWHDLVENGCSLRVAEAHLFPAANRS